MKPLRSIKYHDRTNLIPATQLSLFSVKVGKQEREILSIFTANPDKEFNCWQIMDELKGIGVIMLVTSVRRSLNALKKTGWITTTTFEQGPFGRPCYSYQLNKKK